MPWASIVAGETMTTPSSEKTSAIRRPSKLKSGLMHGACGGLWRFFFAPLKPPEAAEVGEEMEAEAQTPAQDGVSGVPPLSQRPA